MCVDVEAGKQGRNRRSCVCDGGSGGEAVSLRSLETCATNRLQTAGGSSSKEQWCNVKTSLTGQNWWTNKEGSKNWVPLPSSSMSPKQFTFPLS